MAMYLVVAHQTAASPELTSSLQEINGRDADAEFVLLVPATQVTHLLTWTEGESLEIARTVARDASSKLREHGLNVIDTVVGDQDPLKAIEAEYRSRGRPYAATVLCTLPLGVSRWLRRDLPNRLRKRGVEVVHVESRAEARKVPAA